YSSRDSLLSLFVSSSLKRVWSSSASLPSSREMKPSWFLSSSSNRASRLAPVAAFLSAAVSSAADVAMGSARIPAAANAIKVLIISSAPENEKVGWLRQRTATRNLHAARYDCGLRDLGGGSMGKVLFG